MADVNSHTMCNGNEKGIDDDEIFRDIVLKYAQNSTNMSTKLQGITLPLLISKLGIRKEIPNAVIKKLVHVTIANSLKRSDNKHYRHSLFRLLEALYKKNATVTTKYILESFSTIFPLQNSSFSKHEIQLSLTATKWLLFFKEGLNEIEWRSTIRSFIDVLSSFAMFCTFSPKTYRAFGRRLKHLDSSTNQEILLAIQEMLNEESADLNKFFVLMAHFCANNPMETCNQAFTRFFIKSILMGKSRPSSKLLDSWSTLFRSVTYDHFYDTLFPAIKKAMLRCPEIAVWGLERLVYHSKIDFSTLAEEFYKIVLVALLSLNDEIRECAVSIIGKMCGNVRSTEALMNIIKMLLHNINGSDGKIMVMNQKVSIVAALKTIIHRGYYGDEIFESLRHEIYLSLFSHIHKNASAALLVPMWETVREWSKQETPTSHELENFIMQWLECPVSREQALVTTVYILSKCGHEGLSRAIAYCTKVLGDGKYANATEYLCCVLIQNKTNQFDSGAAHNSLVPIANDFFIREKFLGSLTDSGAFIMVEICELLFSHYPNTSMPNKCSNEFIASINGLYLASFWPSFNVRRKAIMALRKIVSLNGIQFCEAALSALYDFIVSGSADQIFKKVYASPNRDRRQADRSNVNAKLLKPLISILLLQFDANQQEDAVVNNLVASALRVSSLPRIVEHNGHLWPSWLETIANPSVMFTDDSIAFLVNSVFSCPDLFVRENAVKMLTSFGVMKKPFYRESVWMKIDEIFSQLDCDHVIGITDGDFAIWKTPDGVLCNTKIIEESNENEIEYKNVKRENKAYKFKEQMLDGLIRKEIAEKKRKEGKLTERQQKAVEAEISSERNIREELEQLRKTFDAYLRNISAAIAGNPSGAVAHVNLLYEYIIPLLKSQLISPLAFRAFRDFCSAAFEPSDDHLNDLVLHASVRLLGSAYCDQAWSEEQLPSQVERTVGLLLGRCITAPALLEDCENEENIVTEEQLLRELEEDEAAIDIAKFCIVLPLIRSVLNDNAMPYVLQRNCIQFISSVLDSRFIKNKETALLPLKDICKFLMPLLSSSNVDLAQHAFRAMENFCKLLDGCEMKEARMLNVLERIMDNLTSNDPNLRENVLQLLSLCSRLYEFSFTSASFEGFVEHFKQRIFIACFDENEFCASLAANIWKEQKLTTNPKMYTGIINEVICEEEFMRISTSEALVALIKEFPSILENLVFELCKLYETWKKEQEAVFDEVGRLVKEPVDPWSKRMGVSRSLLGVSHYLNESVVMTFLKIIVPSGLDDVNESCREILLKAGVEAVKNHGQSQMDQMLPFFEELLDTLSTGRAHDNIRQGLVILLGTLAQYIDPSNAKVRVIAGRLIEILSTPSQQVQEAVSKCIPALVPAIKDDAERLAQTLLVLVVEADTYGERRGASYGIAGLIKGMGMVSIHRLEIMKQVEEYMTNGNCAKHREGGLLILEMLCSTIGKLFEPYAIITVPSLLISFGDDHENVRRAAQDAAREMMSILSAYGVKLILPSILTALDRNSWRTKCASAELLGAMSFCAPKQLSSCLPDIVPKLLEVLADSHSKVQNSSEKALKQIANVVRNPEILAISGSLLTGLFDPAAKTMYCLQTIINTRFVHYIDAASLALIMPIVRRAFSDRKSEARRLAAQIIANIYALTEIKDIGPYLHDLIPGLQESLLDPVPEIRNVAAKAFGAIVSCSDGGTVIRLHEEIIPWLKAKLVSRTSPVDRSGAAQGLSEVLKALGNDQLEIYMSEVIKITESDTVSPEVRDGYILLYIFLPLVFESEFADYLPRIVPSILKALADKNEYVRTSALKAGQRLITMYSSHARRLLLPQLQSALFDENWRIRYASVSLIGDFLFNITGISNKMTSATSNEDDTMGMENVGRVILRQLGQRSRDTVLAGMYLARSDVALQVKQAAGHVWKVIVHNSPRTLKEIMTTLIEMLLACLSSKCNDLKQMGARCLGELVKKMGERIIVDVLPALEFGLTLQTVEQRKGVAIALSEIIANTTKDIVSLYSLQLLAPMKKALSDPSMCVRKAAAATFSTFYEMMGHSIFDGLVGPLLDDLRVDDTDTLDGLVQIMRLCSRQMLPYVLPKLTRPPVNLEALCALVSVAGDSLNRNIGHIMDSLLVSCDTEESLNLCLGVLLSVSDRLSASVIVSTLMRTAFNGEHVASSSLLKMFIKETKVDLADFAEEIFCGTILLYLSSDVAIIENAIQALTFLTQSFDQKRKGLSVFSLKNAVLFLQTQAVDKPIPGMSDPKALSPCLPIVREALISTSADMIEVAGSTLSILVRMCSSDALKSHVINITGPLIRVLGSRYSPTINLNVLNIFIDVFDKVEGLLRPFLPQLQSTFLKCLQEPAPKNMLLAAGGALSRLVKIYTKPEPIVTELIRLLSVSDDSNLTVCLLTTLRSVISHVHDKLEPETLKSSRDVAEKSAEHAVDVGKVIAASSLYGEVILRSNSLTTDFLRDIESGTNLKRRHSMLVALQHICEQDARTVLKNYGIEGLRPVLTSAMQCDKAALSSAGVRATYEILRSMADMDIPLLTTLARTINHQSNDVKRLVAVAVDNLSLKKLANQEMKVIVPMIINGTMEKNTAVRVACELAFVTILKMRTDSNVFTSYASSVEGAAKNILTDTHKGLIKLSRQSDSGSESVSDIIDIP